MLIRAHCRSAALYKCPAGLWVNPSGILICVGGYRIFEIRQAWRRSSPQMEHSSYTYPLPFPQTWKCGRRDNMANAHTCDPHHSGVIQYGNQSLNILE